eukprot:365856-Chlamydomonas_euryale.AAC.9
MVYCSVGSHCSAGGMRMLLVAGGPRPGGSTPRSATLFWRYLLPEDDLYPTMVLYEGDSVTLEWNTGVTLQTWSEMGWREVGLWRGSRGEGLERYWIGWDVVGPRSSALPTASAACLP